MLYEGDGVDIIEELFVYEALLLCLLRALSLVLSSASAEDAPLLAARTLLLELFLSAAVATGGGMGCETL